MPTPPPFPLAHARTLRQAQHEYARSQSPNVPENHNIALVHRNYVDFGRATPALRTNGRQTTSYLTTPVYGPHDGEAKVVNNPFYFQPCSGPLLIPPLNSQAYQTALETPAIPTPSKPRTMSEHFVHELNNDEKSSGRPLPPTETQRMMDELLRRDDLQVTLYHQPDGVSRILNNSQLKELLLRARARGCSVEPHRTMENGCLPIDVADVTLFVKKVEVKEETKPLRFDDEETKEEFKQRLIHVIGQMMFVSGEQAEPSAETTWMIEEIVREQVLEMVCCTPYVRTITHTIVAQRSNCARKSSRIEVNINSRFDFSNTAQYPQSIKTKDLLIMERRAEECQRLRRQRWRRC